MTGWAAVSVLDAKGIIRAKSVKGEAIDDLLAEMGHGDPKPDSDAADEGATPPRDPAK